MPNTNTAEAASRSANERRCPRCGKAAAVAVLDEQVYCRHAAAVPPSCDYVATIDEWKAVQAERAAEDRLAGQ